MFDGWFRSEGMMSAVSQMIQIATQLSEKETKSVAQIAVFAEGEAMYRVRKSSGLASVCLADIRRTMAECGAAYDLYSIGDVSLPQMDCYQLYLFVNQYDLTEETKKQITERLEKDKKTVLWLYAPDYARQGKTNVKHISDVVGMNVEESSTSHGAICFGEESVQYDLAAPYFCIRDEQAAPIAWFADGTVAAAYKEQNGYRSVYAATCNIPSKLMRHIIELAGVFLYSKNDRVYVYPNSACIGAYNASEEDALIYLPENGVYRELLREENFECCDGKMLLPKEERKAFLLVK